jgi:exosortase/archaeosortase family protein
LPQTLPTANPETDAAKREQAVTEASALVCQRHDFIPVAPDAVQTDRDRRPNWQALFAGALIILLLGAIAPTAMIWFDTERSRSLQEALPPLIAMGFLGLGGLANWPRFVSEKQKRSWWGLACVVICSMLLNATGYFKLFHTMFPLSVALVASFIWATQGLQRLRATLPLFFLSPFLLPNVPESLRTTLSLPLQNVCTFLTVQICHWFFPITGSAHHFFVSGLEYDVAPSCSGLSMLASFLFAFAIFQAFERPKRLAYLCIFLFDPIMTVILNTVRLIITAFVGNYVSQATAISIHSNLEFGLVPLGLGVLWLVGKKFRVVKEV